MNQPETTGQEPNAQPTIEDIFGIPFYVFKLMLAGLLLFIVIMTVGFAFEIFPVEDEPEPAAQIVAAIFGGLFAWLGGWLVRSACNTIFRDAGIPEGRFALRLLGFYRQRITLRTLLAGLPYLLMSALLGYTWLNNAPVIGTIEENQDIFVIEYVVLHSTAFLGFLSLIPATGIGKLFKYGLILAFGAIYVLASNQMLALTSFITVLYLLVSKYGGFYLRPPSASVRFALFLRWAVQFATMLMVAAALDNPHFDGRLNLICGFWYFLLLSVYETLDIFTVRTIREAEGEPEESGGNPWSRFRPWRRP